MISSESRRVPSRLQERRRKPRQSITPLVYLKVSLNNGGLLLDLSESGMCVSLANPLVVSEEIRFSFPLIERRTIEGLGRICWVSESGRKAGVEFVECSDSCIEQIEAWLGLEDAWPEKDVPGLSAEEEKEFEGQSRDRKRGADAADNRTKKTHGSGDAVGTEDTANRISSNRQQGSADSLTRADVPAAAAVVPSRQETAAPAVSGHDGRLTIPDTPLFFLPQKKEEHEDVIPDWSNESAQAAAPDETAANGGFDSSDFRSALTTGSAEEEKERHKKSGLGKAVARRALLLLLIVLCFSIYKYEGPLLSLENLVPAANDANDAAILNVTKKTRRTRSIRRSTHPVPGSAEIRRVEPSGGVVSFRVPGVDGGSFSIQGMVPGVKGPSPGGEAGSVSSDEGTNAGGDNAGNDSSTTPPVGSASTMKFIGLMASLRNDGALVVEGGVTPSSPNASKPTSVLEQIVLDVLVGKNGYVRNIRLISSPDSKLAAAVMQSVRKWRYQPFYENGEPVEFTTRITLNFSKPSHQP